MKLSLSYLRQLISEELEGELQEGIKLKVSKKKKDKKKRNTLVLLNLRAKQMRLLVIALNLLKRALKNMIIRQIQAILLKMPQQRFALILAKKAAQL